MWEKAHSENEMSPCVDHVWLQLILHTHSWKPAGWPWSHWPWNYFYEGDCGSLSRAVIWAQSPVPKNKTEKQSQLHCLFISCHFINIVYCSWGLWPRKFVLEGTGWSECLQKPGQLAHIWKRKAPYFLINPAMLMTKISLWHENTLLLN